MKRTLTMTDVDVHTLTTDRNTNRFTSLWAPIMLIYFLGTLLSRKETVHIPPNINT